METNSEISYKIRLGSLNIKEDFLLKENEILTFVKFQNKEN